MSGEPQPHIGGQLAVMSRLLAHRGPDGEGLWWTNDRRAGFAHRRLSIIDLSETGDQPMIAPGGAVIVHNGEVYNYVELRDALSGGWRFRGTSDTETILAAYDKYGDDFVDHLRGMFASAIWDPKDQRLIAVRDRFGIKPFYYAVVGDRFLFASEAKALVPFLEKIETDNDALAQYLVFQYGIDDATLFSGIRELMPGHMLTVERGQVNVRRYWDINYKIDWDHKQRYFHNRLRELMDDSIAVHLRSDVPVGGYMSGGIDSSLVSILAARHDPRSRDFFHGKFSAYGGYDESRYAEAGASAAQGTLHQIDITASDFIKNIEDVVYHLDFPVAGPGSFPQFMVSRLAAEHVKVVLGGQGGDEIFGGYARYLLAYFEQCIKAAIDDTYKHGNFVVTIESIIPNLTTLQEYKPLIRKFWADGLFGELDERYFRLIDRSSDMQQEVDWDGLDRNRVFEQFRALFNNAENVRKEAYFDKMTHFDFKCLLPALLHVEDRMGMAHGLESRVPFLDHPLVEFVATVPADVKFQDGVMKHMLKDTFKDAIPAQIAERRDKMGFPVPLQEWFSDGLQDFVMDIFSSEAARSRPFLRSSEVMHAVGNEARFSRKTWGLLNLEIWHRRFQDRSSEWRAMAENAPGEATKAPEHAAAP